VKIVLDTSVVAALLNDVAGVHRRQAEVLDTVADLIDELATVEGVADEAWEDLVDRLASVKAPPESTEGETD
jgi:predicted nucleic acid-binding protein